MTFAATVRLGWRNTIACVESCSEQLMLCQTRALQLEAWLLSARKHWDASEQVIGRKM